jgi:molecular chaperone GrpE
LGTKTNLPAFKAAGKALSNPSAPLSRATLSGCLAGIEAAMDAERERLADARAKKAAGAAAAAAAAASSSDNDPAASALRLLQADFDNFRARAARERDEAFTRAAEDTCAALFFPLLDAWDAAEQQLGAAAAGAEPDGERRVAQSYARLREQALRTLKDEWGVEVVEEARVGLPFDPETMEAVVRDSAAAAGVKDGCVSRVFRAGYRSSDGESARLLRPAMVAVAADGV